MGTFHSFISEPLHTIEEVDNLRKQIKDIFFNSDFNNSERDVYYQQIGKFFVVYGIYKNLGSTAAELLNINNFNLVAVSDENDFSTIDCKTKTI